ncbi:MULTISPECIES: hypothetical protein [unclassified Campylobacter]|nr:MULTISPECIES: hypothetical protein [unclassified Campylobacter]
MDFYIKRHLNFHKNISYSIQFYITHDSLWKNSDGENGFLTTYIRENSAF